ncbi:threonine/serine exporter family protein [Catenulispora sp. NL8]|uniref:Threonine/serine exporter family protein n=1 Tax=Catenulispora pinistramenti TaxID=2705254 RepID=A0ABS5L5N7_9ACTN|nr:threonine/serine exporter family protein [Catenulispora pinistramenti]MBS2553658.1 threonine/serine exporter family protein [Catenulispora pinistramenti]
MPFFKKRKDEQHGEEHGEQHGEERQQDQERPRTPGRPPDPRQPQGPGRPQNSDQPQDPDQPSSEPEPEPEPEPEGRRRFGGIRRVRPGTTWGTARAGAFGDALAGSMDSLDKGIDTAWQGLKNVGGIFRDRRRVGVRAADQATVQWLRQLAGLLSILGAEILRSGANTIDAETQIVDIAARYGVDARCFALPTGIFVRVEAVVGDAGSELDFAPVGTVGMQLNQVEALQNLVHRMLGEAVPFDQVRKALREEQSLPRRFQPATAISGYALLTLALGMLQHPTWNAAPGYIAAGTAVGVLQWLVRRYAPNLLTLLPVAAAIMVTALALRFAGPILHQDPGFLYIPPLIGFLPGAALTLGAIELATNSTLSGVTRLAGALNVLMMLALGILVGVDTVHPHEVGTPIPATLGAWVGWVSVLLLAVGFTLNHDAPSRSLGWLTVALLATRVVQTVGTLVGGQALGAFVAGMALVPTASWIGKRARIPDQVIFLPAFWMVVPGAHGLSGVQQLLVAHSSAGWQTLLNVVITVGSIALGVLAGASLRPTARLEVVPGEEGAGVGAGGE